MYSRAMVLPSRNAACRPTESMTISLPLVSTSDDLADHLADGDTRCRAADFI